METKLTLKLDKNTIDQAKLYAKDNNLSLSKMVEKYFKSLTENKEPKNQITKLVKELSGIIKLDEFKNYKDEQINHLMEKYK